jgi:glycosyltransferase involved in cell wall biosynthesis
MTGRALVLAPSRGRGGGIERYVETLEWAFAAEGVEYRRIDLHGSGLAAQARLLAQSRRQLRASKAPARLIVAHRALLPAASLLSSETANRGISLLCHGVDVWGSQLRARWLVEQHLMRRTRVRVVAVSSFTAGVLAAGCPATILPPGLTQEWFDTLVDASTTVQRRDPGFHLVTAFRLADWRNKGLPQILDAVASLRRPDVQVTVCGSGEPAPDLRQLMQAHPGCTLRPGLTDRELARQLAAADLFVLATRTRHGRHPSGEGFGLVLLEAQVAGTPVVAPARGGSYDAYAEHLTGVAPLDETAGSLARVLDDLLQDPARLEQMGQQAAGWARARFAPERYPALAASRLL